MAMPNKTRIRSSSGARYKLGDACRDAHPEQETKPPSTVLPPKYKDNKPTHLNNYVYHQSRRPHSSARPVVVTQNFTLPASPAFHRKTRMRNSPNRVDNYFSQEQALAGNFNIGNSRRSRTHSRSRRPDSNGTYPSALPPTIEQIMKNIKDLYQEDIPNVCEQHELLIATQNSLLDQLDEDDETRPIKEALLEELRDQLDTFKAVVISLSTLNPSNPMEAENHLNALSREIIRLETHLPIYARRLDLIDLNKSTQVVLLKADTGSGKSTQLVQYLVDAGFSDRGQIVCTQPRRLAARALASRVAEEFGCKIGEEVGFHVGASIPRVSCRTRICFVTHAVLLNEYHKDPMLSAYSIVIIDEAHERSVDADLLFGVMKLCLNRRKDIKAS